MHAQAPNIQGDEDVYKTYGYEEEEESDSDDEVSEEELEEARKAAIKNIVAKNMQSCEEDIDALFSGEALSEEFKQKATTIFEAAVRSRVEAITTEVIAENETILEEMVEQIQEQLTDQVDEYLSYVAENWMVENELAVETGIRTEIAEDFMNGLKDLFVEHYIEVPESKVDIVEEMAQRVIFAEESLEEQALQIQQLAEALNESKSIEILRRTCEGLTEVQVQKIKALAEGVEFTSDGEYADKLAVIRESYFPTKSVKSNGPGLVVETEEEPKSTGTMDHYVKAISKTLPK